MQAPNVDGSGGGGSTYAKRRADTDFLSIEDVLNYKEELLNEKILYTPIIEKGVAGNQVSNACQFIREKKDECQELIDEIEKTLNETESNKYVYGEEAQTHMNAIRKAKDDMNSLAAHLEQLDNYDIEGIVNEYNTALKKFKNGARLKILQAKADEINQVVKDGNQNAKVDGVRIWKRDSQKTYTQTADGYVTASFSNHEGPNLNYFTYTGWHADKPDELGNVKCYVIENEWHYINYWKIIRPDSFWAFLNISDDTVEELETKIKRVLNKLPYDVSKIKE